ncbi:MAG: transglutaminase domain-containing protein [Chloroflexi bacterium]|nr:transglutaminase domain-containing protein [Chloroflexota bacterium]
MKSLFEDKLSPKTGIVRLLTRLQLGEVWFTFVLLALVIWSVVWTVERAHWVDLPPLTNFALLALIVGMVLAKLPTSFLYLHGVGLLLSIAAIAWRMATFLPTADLSQRLTEVGQRLRLWQETVSTGGTTSDPLPFVLLIVSLTWLISYFSAWFVFRKQSQWWGVVPSGIGLVVALSYLPHRFMAILPLYLFASLLLSMRLNFVRKSQQWRHRHVTLFPNMGWSFFHATFWFGLLALGLAWLVPSASALPSFAKVRDEVRQPWEKIQAGFEDLFPSLNPQKSIEAPAYAEGLALRGAVKLGNKTLFLVASDQAHYMRASTYNLYTGNAWLSDPKDRRLLASGEVGASSTKYKMTNEITQKVQLAFDTDVLFADGQPLSASVPALVETFLSPQFTIDLTYSGGDAALPPDILDLAVQWRAAQARGEPINSFLQRLPPGLKAWVTSIDGVRRLAVARDSSASLDIIGLRSPKALKSGDTYTIASAISTASERQLEEAGVDYPKWVSERYLTIPETLPKRVKELAARLTSDLASPYDKASAIESYLRSLPYDFQMKAQPSGRDGVDYFLFTARGGICDYYASAMVVMLRSLGIPSRIATGYYAGNLNQSKTAYVVRERDAHTWPEVYFPSYGWIVFEPTPIWPVLEKKDPPWVFVDPGLEPFLDVYEEPLEEFVSEGGGGVNLRSDRSSWWVVGPLSGGVALVLFSGLALWWLWRRDLSRLELGAQPYAKMSRLASLVGLRVRVGETPRDYTHRLAQALPHHAAAVVEVGDGYMRTTFSKIAMSLGEEKAIDKAWRRLRLGLLLRLLPWRRKDNIDH